LTLFVIEHFPQSFPQILESILPPCLHLSTCPGFCEFLFQLSARFRLFCPISALAKMVLFGRPADTKLSSYRGLRILAHVFHSDLGSGRFLAYPFSWSCGELFRLPGAFSVSPLSRVTSLSTQGHMISLAETDICVHDRSLKLSRTLILSS
jgi:hypothetical protein